MRIDLNHGLPSVPENKRSGTGSQVAAENSAGNMFATDQAELSGAHAQVQAMMAQASQLPEVREERVNALRQALQSGQYRPSAEKIAGALFAHMIFAGSPA
jgi:flagellar biosynthesis anti-sigma factor FlgM